LGVPVAFVGKFGVDQFGDALVDFLKNESIDVTQVVREQGTNAYYANLVLPAQQIYLRIPGAADYWHELDVRISTVLSGATKPKEALDDIYQAWEQITDRYGRESQKRLYAEWG
jgi:sugar/nucleoside kinase (ribokinase family)